MSNSDGVTGIECRGSECMLVSDFIGIKIYTLKVRDVVESLELVESKVVPEGLELVRSSFDGDKIFSVSRKIHRVLEDGKESEHDYYRNEMVLLFKRGVNNTYLHSSVSLMDIGISLDSRSCLSLPVSNPKKAMNGSMLLLDSAGNLKSLQIRGQVVKVIDKEAYNETDYELKFGGRTLPFSSVFLNGTKPPEPEPPVPPTPPKPPQDGGNNWIYWSILGGVVCLIVLVFVCSRLILRSRVDKLGYDDELDEDLEGELTEESYSTIGDESEDERIKLKTI